MKSEIVGVSGLYRQPGTPAHIYWLGWFAIRPQFRRQGFGTSAIHQLSYVARNAGSTELWVYTGSNNNTARTFYLSLGFEVLGPASDYAPGGAPWLPLMKLRCVPGRIPKEEARCDILLPFSSCRPCCGRNCGILRHLRNSRRLMPRPWRGCLTIGNHTKIVSPTGISTLVQSQVFPLNDATSSNRGSVSETRIRRSPLPFDLA